MQNNKYNTKTFNIALVGILMSLCIVFKAIFNYIPIFNGYPLDIYIVPFILGILLINSYIYKWTYLLLTPWVLLIIPSASVNFLDMLMEYILPLYIFFPIIYFYSIISLLTGKVNSKKVALLIELITLIFLVLILFSFKLLVHVFAGYLWYTSGNWYASLVINAQIIFLIYGIDTPILCLSYCSIRKIYTMFYYGKTKE